MTHRILTTIGGAPVGCAEAFFVTLTVALQRAGHVVHCALRPSPIREADLAAAGIPYDSAPFGGQFEFWTALKLAAAAYKFQPELVLSFGGRANWHMPRGNYTRIGRLGGYYKMKYFKHCDYLVCNAPDLVRHVVEAGWPRERVELISNFPILMEGEGFDRAAFDTPEGVPLGLAINQHFRSYEEPSACSAAGETA